MQNLLFITYNLGFNYLFTLLHSTGITTFPSFPTVYLKQCIFISNFYPHTEKFGYLSDVSGTEMKFPLHYRKGYVLYKGHTLRSSQDFNHSRSNPQMLFCSLLLSIKTNSERFVIEQRFRGLFRIQVYIFCYICYLQEKQPVRSTFA